MPFRFYWYGLTNRPHFYTVNPEVSKTKMRAIHMNFSVLSLLLLLLRLSPSLSSPFPTWSFQYPNSKMEWNLQHPIRIHVEDTVERAGQYDCIVIGIPDHVHNANALGWIFRQVDAKYSGILSKWLEEEKEEVSPKSDNNVLNSKKKKSSKEDWEEVSKVCKVSLDGNILVQRLVICRIKGVSSRKVGRIIGSKLASAMQKAEGEKWAFLLPPLGNNTTESAQSTLLDTHSDFLSEMVVTLWSDLYKDHRFKSSPKEKRRVALDPHNSALLDLDLIWDHPSPEPTTPPAFLVQAKDAVAKGETIAAGIYLTKDIVNAPHNVLNSLSLAETARRLAAEYPRLSCNILNADDCERLGMGGKYLARLDPLLKGPLFVNCMMLMGIFTNRIQLFWGWQEDRRHRHNSSI
jgi:hypothetical protein